MTIAKPELLRCVGDLFEFLAVNRNIDVLGLSSATGSAHADPKENRKSSDDAILDAHRSERGVKALDPFKELIHVSIVGAGGDHSQPHFCTRNLSGVNIVLK